MNSIIRAVILLCFTACLVFPSDAENAVDPKPLDAMVDKAMAGYNAGDAKVFFADYAKSMAGIATPQMFDLMYKGPHLNTDGKYISRKTIKAETVLLGDSPLVVYAAEFEKNKKVKISVNFTKEDGAFKVMQITIAGM